MHVLNGLQIMSKRLSLEGLLAQAKEEEKKYDWPASVNFHKKALRLATKSEDFWKAGEIQERVGYCLYRGAFQAERQDEFKSRMLEAVEAYKRAAEVYEKVEHAKSVYCKAMALFANSWVHIDACRKGEALDDSGKLLKESIKAFGGAGDRLGYGKACNDLLFCLDDANELEWDWTEAKRRLEEAIEYSQDAISELSKVGDERELARAYYRVGHYSISAGLGYLGEEKRAEFTQMALSYAEKALELSKKTGDAFLISRSNLIAASIHVDLTGNLELSLKHAEEGLQQAKKIRDGFLMGWGNEVLAEAIFGTMTIEEYPDKKREGYERVIRYAEDALRRFLVVCRYDDLSGVYSLLGESYYYLALDVETDPEERRNLLERAIEVGRKGLEYAEKAGSPVIAAVRHSLSKALYSLSKMQTQITEKRRLLEEASEHREKSISISERTTPPFLYWGRGVAQNYVALIKAEFARIETDKARKRSLLEEAVSHMERCIELCTRWTTIYPDAELFAAFGWYYGWFGGIVNQLYSLTGEEETLKKAINVYEGTAETYRKAELPSRVAEAYWHVARLCDQLGEYTKAEGNFQSASENYRLAAQKIPQLKGFYSEYASYMEAWAELEKSRQEHGNENYAQSREHYRMCSRNLAMTKKWAYLSSYYFAWALLEHGEELSRLDRPQDAMKAFDEAGRTFGDSVNSLRMKVGKLEDSEERDEASKLAAIARLRKQYCMGRVLMEKAKLSNGKGDKMSGAKKYASAARIFEGIVPNLEREEARVELQFAASLCRAWEKMELAEERRDAALFRKAAELFAKAGEITRKKTAGLIAVGNSCFCEALELGMKFMATSNVDFYSGAKLRMENAAGYYQRAGFEKAALWVEATKRLFDAHVYAGKAEAEAEPEKRVRFYLTAEKCLELSAKLHGKAGYPDRRNKVLQSLERVRKERKLALSLSEVLTAPTILSSTTGVSMPDSTEKAAGLNEFESVSIRARLSVPDEFIPGEEFQVKLDLVNLGKKPGLLVRVEGLAPRKCEVLRVPSYCALEDDSLNLGGRRLGPLSVESISIWVQVRGLIGVSLSPRVVYVDELGNFKTTRVEEAKILPIVEFESRGAQVVFNYLVNAFVEDSVRLRLSVEKSGWRSFPQIIKGAGVSKRSLYGAGGRLGSGLSELRRKGLVDLKTFRGERGRGGHILRVRIHHEKELVKRYVKEKAPDLSV